MIYLNSYHPLALYPSGWKAAELYDLPPYADASCRREPDLEANYPAISALCRVGKFAPRLKVGDIAVYVTVSGYYPPLKSRSDYRLTAVLEVIERFDDHESAATWYRNQGQSLPCNCMVAGNPPLPLEQTVGFYYIENSGTAKTGKKKHRRVPQDVAEWDRLYQKRVAVCSVMLACKPLYIELHKPVAFDRETATNEIFTEYGKMPGTLTPPVIPPADFHRLMDFCGTDVRVDTERHTRTPHS